MTNHLPVIRSPFEPGDPVRRDAVHGRAAHEDPLGAPGSQPATRLRGGHLEEPEWSRRLLELVYGTAAHDMPLVWLLQAEGITAFSETGELPAPFRARPEGVGSWMPRDRLLLDAGRNQLGAKRAGLVTMWHDDGGRCLFDVVAARTVALDGPPVALGYTLADLVVELAARRWCDIEELYLVDFGRETHGLEGVRYLSSLEDATSLVSAWDRVGKRGARAFVIAPMPVDSARRASLRRFLEVVEQTPFVGAVCCETDVGAHCTWRVAAHAHTTRLDVAGRRGRALVVTPERWVERLGPSQRVAFRRVPLGPRRGEAADHPSAAYPSPTDEDSGRQPGVEILVLGPVEVHGVARSLQGRPLLKELVTYLAMHPEGVTGEACAHALWPDRRVPPQTLANRLSEARRALGCAPDGPARLVRAGGRHRLGAEVRTDWSRFLELSGEGTGPSQWRRAVMLLRGRPLEGLAQGDWAVLEGHVASIETKVLEVAWRLGEHLLGVGDTSGVEWVVRRGLLVSSWDERLYRLLMRAADATGNRGGVEAALRSLGQVLECPGDPLAIVHPETAALYRRLMERYPD